MHVGDALVSPTVAGVMWFAAIGFLAVAVKNISKREDRDTIAPLMGVMGAFIFACQMINFTIPGTGSSGHIVGGVLLAAVLGPWAAFITLSSVLVVQALFFADGGLLAMGCNLFNMGVATCLIAYQFIYRVIVKTKYTPGRLMWASIIACTLGLEIGAFFVTIQTEMSGITALPIRQFLLFMLPIHFVIGIIEGLATGVVLFFIFKYKPSLLFDYNTSVDVYSKRTAKRALITLSVAALLIGGCVSWFASMNPDGLEWSVERVIDRTKTERPTPSKVFYYASKIQEQTSLMPDYAIPNNEREYDWGEVNSGTTLAGVAGAGFIIVIALVVGAIVNHKGKRHEKTRKGI